MIPNCGDAPDLSRCKLIVGAKQLKKAIANGAVSQVYLAMNADPDITEPLEAMCIQKGIPFFHVSTMTELGRACRIEVGAAAAAVVK